MVYNFRQWDNFTSLNEANALEKIFGWFGSIFGGTVSKIDSYLEDIIQLEEDYAKEWDKIMTDLDELEVQKAQISNDPAESRKLDRMIDRNEKLLQSALRKKNSSISDIEEKVRKLTEKDSKLVSYWNLKKTKAEKDVAERLYYISKKLTNPDLGEELYDKYKKAALAAKEKDEDFRQKYGDMRLPGSPSKYSYSESPTIPEKSRISKGILSRILNMSDKEFEKHVQKLGPSEIKDLKSDLIHVKNEMLRLRSLDLKDYGQDASSKGLSKVEIKMGESNIRNKHLGRISDIRDKITYLNRYV